MAALMRLRIEPIQGDAYEVNVTPKVIVELERHFSKPMTDILGGDSVSFEAIYWAAWKGTQIAGRPTKPFDEWLDDVETVEPVEEARVPLENP
jgi:hypothetical protein